MSLLRQEIMQTHLRWYFLELQSTRARNDSLLINLYPRERRNLRSRRNDDILRLDLRLPTFRQLDIDLAGTSKRRFALDIVHTVLLEQVRLDTARQGFDGGVFGCKHFREIELDVADVYAAGG